MLKAFCTLLTGPAGCRASSFLTDTIIPKYSLLQKEYKCLLSLKTRCLLSFKFKCLLSFKFKCLLSFTFFREGNDHIYDLIIGSDSCLQAFCLQVSIIQFICRFRY